MRRGLPSLCIAAACVIAAAQGVETRRVSTASAPLDAFARLPLAFEPNRGQADPSVRFLARGRGATVFLTDTGAVFALGHGPSHRTVRMTFAGARPAADAAGDGLLRGRANYFIGDDPALWRTDVPTFRRVRYTGLYPGVDLVYYSSEGGHLEYDLIVAPGATPDRIRLAFDGSDALTLDPAGNIVARAGDQEIRILRPRIFQEAGGPPHAVDGGYVLDPVTREIGFRVASYDPTKPLIVDPAVIYLAQIGGSTGDTAGGVAVDALGNVYLAGLTQDVANFPGPGNSKPVAIVTGGDNDVFVAKIDAAGSDLIFSTVLGGTDAEGTLNSWPAKLAVDAAGQSYVVGKTGSLDFPTTANGYSDCKTGHVFLAKLNESGSQLVYSTCLTSGNAGANAVALGPDATVYIWGKTGDGLAIKGGFQTQYSNEEDMFLAKFDTKKAGDASLLYSTYFGGIHQEENFGVGGVAVDGSGNAYVTAYTSSRPGPPPDGDGFPVTPGAYITTCDPCVTQNFVAKINPSAQGAQSLVYSTYSGLGFGNAGVAVDKAHNVYVTEGANFVALDATFSKKLSGSNHGGAAIAVDTPATQVFLPDGILDITAVNPVFTALPPSPVAIRAIAVDAACSVYRAGSGSGVKSFGPLGILQKGAGGMEAMVDKVGPAGPLAYVPNQFGNTVTVVDTTNNTIVGNPIAVGSQPVGVAITPDANYVFVANQTITATEGTVSIIDTTNNNSVTPVALNKLTGEPRNVVIVARSTADVNGHKVKAYVTTAGTGGANATVTVLDAESGSNTFGQILGSPVSTDPNPEALAATAAGDVVYVATPANGQGALTPINTSTDGAGSSQSLASGDTLPQAMTAGAGLLFIVGADANNAGFLEIRTLPGLALAQTKDKNPLPLPLPANGLALTPDGSRLYVAQRSATGKDGLLAIDAAPGSGTFGKLLKSIDVGSYPIGVAAHPDGDRVYVTNSGANTVSVVDIETDVTPQSDVVVATLTVGAFPYATGAFIAPRLPANPDADGDGIVDAIEKAFNQNTQQFDYTKDYFTNQHLCGNAFGHVENRNGLKLTVENKAGLVLKASGSGGPAEFTLCGDPYVHKLSSGNVYAVSPCGSTTVSLKAGPPVAIDLGGDSTLSMPAGATVRIVNTGGTPQIQNLGSEKSVDLLSSGLLVASIAPNSIFSGSFTPPTLSLPPDMNVEATSSLGAVVNYVVQVPDGLVATCTPASGSTFPIAATMVSCSATDRAGNSLGSGSFTVTVRDTTPPALILPSTTVAEATGPAGAFVTLRASATDIVDGAVPVMCSPSLDSMFPLGTTTVTCSATDAHANASTGTFNVVVQDTTPPAIAVPPDMTGIVDSRAGSAVIYVVSARDLVDGATLVTCTPASGSIFPAGTTTVRCTSTDAHGNTASASFTVTLTVATPAQITSALIADVEAAGLRQSSGLLQNALRNIGANNTAAACGQLGAFVHQVEAQSGKSITAGTAAMLVQEARGAMAGLGCR